MNNPTKTPIQISEFSVVRKESSLTDALDFAGSSETNVVLVEESDAVISVFSGKDISRELLSGNTLVSEVKQFRPRIKTTDMETIREVAKTLVTGARVCLCDGCQHVAESPPARRGKQCIRCSTGTYQCY